MEPNILDQYGFLTRPEYESFGYEIVFGRFRAERVDEANETLRPQWKVHGADQTYPKTQAKAMIELRRRGLDPGNEDYGLARVIESGDVCPAGGMWKKSDIDLAMISLAEFGCIEPWIGVCNNFNIRPVEYVKARRKAVEENIDRLGQYADEPLFYIFEFAFGDGLLEPGTLTMRLRDDWQRIVHMIHGGHADAEKEK